MLRPIRKVKRDGWNALVDRLGVAGATLFALEYEQGYGDYTRERKRIFDKKRLDEILKEIKQRVRV